MIVLSVLLRSKWLIVAGVGALMLGALVIQHYRIKALKGDVAVAVQAAEINAKAFDDEHKLRLRSEGALRLERNRNMNTFKELLKNQREIRDIAEETPAACPPSPALRRALEHFVR